QSSKTRAAVPSEPRCWQQWGRKSTTTSIKRWPPWPVKPITGKSRTKHLQPDTAISTSSLPDSTRHCVTSCRIETPRPLSASVGLEQGAQFFQLRLIFECRPHSHDARACIQKLSCIIG